MPSELPLSSSPTYQPLKAPRPQRLPHHLSINDEDQQDNSQDEQEQDGASPPPSLLSPAFTPPSTPGSETPWQNKRSKSIPVDSSNSSAPPPKLLDVLPEVECVVRARIPTITGQEMFLHLYTNNIDNKEHLAIVFGPHIRSRSLDRQRPGETEMDRMIRGAYTGRLFPGRTSSKVDPSKVTTDAAGSSTPTSSRGNPDKHAAPATSNPPPQNLSKPVDLSADDDDDPTPVPTIANKRDPMDRGTYLTNPPLVRIHSECYTGETVWSARCDCGEQLDEAARLMALPTAANTPNNLSAPPSPPAGAADSASAPSSSSSPSNPGGVIIYLRQEGRGIGLSEKLKAYNLQDLGSDTVEANLLLRHPADARSYGLATSMLVDLGLGGDLGIRLMTNNPDKVRAVEGPGREVRVRERVAMVPLAWKTGGRQGVRSVEVESYLKTKIEQFGHMIGYGDSR